MPPKLAAHQKRKAVERSRPARRKEIAWFGVDRATIYSPE
jgi:hypothetical protein